MGGSARQSDHCAIEDPTERACRITCIQWDAVNFQNSHGDAGYVETAPRSVVGCYVEGHFDRVWLGLQDWWQGNEGGDSYDHNHETEGEEV